MTTFGIILAASASCSAYFLSHARQPPSTLRTASKTGATALLGLLTVHHNGVTLLPFALALGSLGDLFLAISDTDDDFLRGLGSFLLAHLVYIKILLDKSLGFGLLLSNMARVLTLSIMLLVAPGLNYLMLARIKKNLRIPIMVYSAVIFGMFVSALCVEDTMATLGAVIFTLSDSLLAIDRFLLPQGSRHAAWMQYSVWLFYYTGQLLLALGLSG